MVDGDAAQHDALVRRALDYPYDRPAHAFVLDPARGEVHPASADKLDDAARDRTAVLAVGSNGAPAQLRRKFAGSSAPVVVAPATAIDHDVVYAARVSSYGAVPVTRLAVRGTRAQVHVTFLDRAQLRRMHETEGLGHAYRATAVDPAAIDCAVPLPATVWAYDAVAGPLAVDGAAVACSSVAAEGRSLPSWSQHEVLTWLAGSLGRSPQELIGSVVGDPDVRREVLAWLAARSTAAAATAR